MSYILWDWQPPADEVPSSYNLYVGRTSGSETLLASNIPATTYEQQNPQPGDWYGYVTANFEDDETLQSNEATTTVFDTTVPVPNLQGFGVLVANEPVNLLTGS